MARNKIFISYRRDDAPGDAHSLYQRLERTFGKRRVFMDVDTIQLGEDFRATLKSALSETRALVVLIGPRWLDGGRLANDDDFVRMEIREALAAGIAVLPVLLGETPFPAKEALPEDVRPLIFRQALRVRYESFGVDMAALEKALKAPSTPTPTFGALRGLAAAAAVAGGLGWAYTEGWFDATDTAPITEQTPPPNEIQAPSPAELRAASEAREAEAAWALLRDARDVAALKRFRERFPNSAQDAEARAAIARLEQEAAAARELTTAWELVQDTSDIAALKRFRQRYPNSVHDADAEARIARLERAKPVTRGRADGEVFRDCPSCPEMVVVPGGSFQMGSTDGDNDEKPVRTVRVNRFAIGKYEVTFDEWAACVADGYCRSNRTPDDQGWGRGRRPVITVSWNDITGANGFIDWLNFKTGAEVYRLPSEAEWEYAARANSQGAYSFGDSDGALSRYAWYRANSGGKTHPVGQKLPNAFGLHDMHGNVWEWVQDCWNKSYSGAPDDGSAWMSGDCSVAVLRGGSWNITPGGLRSANRLRFRRTSRGGLLGFRLARTLLE